MKSKAISNSKYKNSGVLFELLVRQVTADTLANKPASAALTIMQRYFNSSTELGKELQLYRAFFDSKKLSEVKALHFIDWVVAQRKTLNERKLMREKYNLIKEIKEQYSLKDFLACKIADYTVYASIYKTFATECAEEGMKISNINEVANARYTLVEHLCGERKVVSAPEPDAFKELREQDENFRMLTYKIIVDKFNAKYRNLNENQKALLREYINSVGDASVLAQFVREKSTFLQKNLRQLAKIEQDKIVKIKLNEVSTQLEKFKTATTISDAEVTALLIAYEMQKEIADA